MPWVCLGVGISRGCVCLRYIHEGGYIEGLVYPGSGYVLEVGISFKSRECENRPLGMLENFKHHITY